jgi:hypothetical protein
LDQYSLQAQPFPELPEQVGSSQRNTLDEGQCRGLFSQASLGLKDILWGEETAEALDQSLDGDHIEGIGPAEDVENLGSGLAGSRVADVVGQLDVGGSGAIFVLAGNGSDIHAYLDSMYLYLCQENNYIVHAYAFSGFNKSALSKINNLAD